MIRAFRTIVRVSWVRFYGFLRLFFNRNRFNSVGDSRRVLNVLTGTDTVGQYVYVNMLLYLSYIYIFILEPACLHHFKCNTGGACFVFKSIWNNTAMSSEIENATVLLRDMFYLSDPRRHMHEDIKHVPRIYAQVIRTYTPLIWIAGENVLIVVDSPSRSNPSNYSCPHHLQIFSLVHDSY